MKLFHSLLAFLLSLAIVLSTSVHTYAQTANACANIARSGALFPPEVEKVGTASPTFSVYRDATDASQFDEQNAFDLQVREEADGFHVRLTGDNIILSENTARSMIADAGFAKTGLKELVVDARRVTLQDPLSFQDANIRIIAENVLVTGEAQVNLFASAPGRQRSLSIVADELQFVDSRRRPFDLQFSVTAGASVRFYILNATFNSTSIENKDAFWRRFTDSIELDDSPSEVEIFLGADAEEEVSRVFTEEMTWPIYFVSKLKQNFNIAPFDRKANEKIVELIDQYRPVMEKWAQPYPLVAIEVISSAIANEVDFLGRNSAFTPKQDVWDQIKTITNSIDKESFDRLIRIIVATAAKKDESTDAVKALRNEIQKAEEEQRLIQDRISEATRRLGELSQENQSLDTRISQRAVVLEEMSRREFERLKDAQSVKQWTTIAASVVLVAASFGAATPAVAGAAATGLSLTGNQIYRHNIGEPFKVIDLIETGTKTYEAITGFQKSWGEFLKNKDIAKAVVYNGETVYEEKPQGSTEDPKPISKFTATKQFVASLVILVKKADELSSGQPPGPTPLSLTERENEDEVMKGLLTERAEFNGEINSLAAQVQADSRLIEGLEGQIADLSIKVSELLEVDPMNDQQNARWNGNAYILWALQVQAVAEMVASLKKSVLFETGRALTGTSDVLDYPNVLLTRIDAGIFDITGGCRPRIHQGSQTKPGA